MGELAIENKFEIFGGGAGQTGFALAILGHGESYEQPGDAEENDDGEDIPLHAFWPATYNTRVGSLPANPFLTAVSNATYDFRDCTGSKRGSKYCPGCRVARRSAAGARNYRGE